MMSTTEVQTKLSQIPPVDRCDNCKKKWETEMMWFAYKYSERIAICNDCYIKPGQPVDYAAVAKWLENNRMQLDDMNLKLFVWTGVLRDYTDGIIFALARTVEEAREVVENSKEDWMDVYEIYEKDPEIVSSPKGFVLYGGG